MKKILLITIFTLFFIVLIFAFRLSSTQAANLGWIGACRVFLTERGMGVIQASNLEQVQNYYDLYEEHWDLRADHNYSTCQNNCSLLQRHIDQNTDLDELEVLLIDNWRNVPTAARYVCQSGVPDNAIKDAVKNLNDIYVEMWDRPINYNELIFHLSHSTPHDVLRNWLRTESERIFTQDFIDIYKGYNGKTISTPHKDPPTSYPNSFYLLTSHNRYLAPDYPTALSWGLLIEDRTDVRGDVARYIFSHFPRDGLLQYTEGPYYQEIQAYWDTGVIGEALPERLKQELGGDRKISSRRYAIRSMSHSI